MNPRTHSPPCRPTCPSLRAVVLKGQWKLARHLWCRVRIPNQFRPERTVEIRQITGRDYDINSSHFLANHFLLNCNGFNRYATMKTSTRRWIGAGLCGVSFLATVTLFNVGPWKGTLVASSTTSNGFSSATMMMYEGHFPSWLIFLLIGVLVLGFILILLPGPKKPPRLTT
jgi:hypothetical protein